MHANRLLRGSGRAHEVVLYDFLTRLYELQAARAGDPTLRPATPGRPRRVGEETR